MALSHVLLALLGIVARTLAQDPYDLSYIQKGAAVGDSYAAGIGAGNSLDWSCSRYDGSYANMVARSLDDDPDTIGFDFTYSACSGAVIDGVNSQVNALSTGQEFIIISAGGNDADLVGILNSCVYSFWGGLSHPSCDAKLAESGSSIRSGAFAPKVDGLINNAKSKLATGGNIYYVGYAKFFDTTDRVCDGVSWHIWLNLFSREYLTLERRIAMNNVVDLMNQALQDAVARAGPQVHFIDYDTYVGETYGRYCSPKIDENSGNGANREDLFFYEMKSVDTPWTQLEDSWWNDELKRRSNSINDDGDIEPANSTLNALYGALVQEAIDDDTTVAALEEDNANNDLDAEVDSEESAVKKRFVPRLKHNYLVPGPPHSRAPRGLITTDSTTGSIILSMLGQSPGTPDEDEIQTTTQSTQQQPSQTTKITLSQTQSAPPFTNSSGGVNVTVPANDTSNGGIIVANSTHVVLASGQIVSKVSIRKLIVSDKTSRVFHPTQAGHSLIANLILYQMAAVNAQRLGITEFPPQEVNKTSNGWQAVNSPACNTDSTDTWTDRTAMINALNDFCALPDNLRGTAGQTISGQWNLGTLDYMNISVNWQNTINIGQHSCEAWLATVTDGCDVPGPGGENAANLKHGGHISYGSDTVDAIMTITPLTVQRIWDKGQAGGQFCQPIDTLSYLDQPTLQANIEDYCQKSLAQPGGVAQSGQKFELVYNDGTPDRVVLTTEWPVGPLNFQIFQEECQYYMSVLNNGCSISGSDNPLNWKHGGNMTDHNGIRYTIQPTQTRPPPPSSPQGTCKTDYKVLYYSWNIYGGGFDNSDYGAALKQQMSGCGALTSWQFDYYDTPDGNVEWHASGKLPILIKSGCVGRALASAGGFSVSC